MYFNDYNTDHTMHHDTINVKGIRKQQESFHIHSLNKLYNIIYKMCHNVLKECFTVLLLAHYIILP